MDVFLDRENHATFALVRITVAFTYYVHLQLLYTLYSQVYNVDVQGRDNNLVVRDRAV